MSLLHECQEEAVRNVTVNYRIEEIVMIVKASLLLPVPLIEETCCLLISSESQRLLTEREIKMIKGEEVQIIVIIIVTLKMNIDENHKEED